MITAQATTNPLQSLQSYGQSVWLDYIRRSLITSGELLPVNSQLSMSKVENCRLKARSLQQMAFNSLPIPKMPQYWQML